MKKPELLAPAGSMTMLRAAVDAGADAVYLGLNQYNARIHAANFTLETLREALEYAHLRNARIYVTLNTLLDEDELMDAVELALFLKDYGFVPDQVQDFYPTPGTMATCMYYTGIDPMTMKPVYVAKDMEEKKMQRALMHYNKPENRGTVIKALRKAGREDLINVLLRDSKGKRTRR